MTSAASGINSEQIHKVGLFKEALRYTAQIWQKYKY